MERLKLDDEFVGRDYFDIEHRQGAGAREKASSVYDRVMNLRGVKDLRTAGLSGEAVVAALTAHPLSPEQQRNLLTMSIESLLQAPAKFTPSSSYRDEVDAAMEWHVVAHYLYGQLATFNAPIKIRLEGHATDDYRQLVAPVRPSAREMLMREVEAMKQTPDLRGQDSD